MKNNTEKLRATDNKKNQHMFNWSPNRGGINRVRGNMETDNSC